jgi:hypothetical protein
MGISVLSKVKYKTNIFRAEKNKIKIISKAKKDIKNSKTPSVIYSQLIKTHIGINNRVKITNQKEMPSTPNLASLLKNTYFVWN